MLELSIRKYSFQDRYSLLKIAADTAFFGDPIEAYLDDRQLFLDAFYAPYLELEPDYCWVACVNDQVIGFLTGCIDSRVYFRKIKREIIPQILIGLLRRKYIIRAKSIKYIFGLITSFPIDRIHSINNLAYPAHLHINLDKDYRGKSFGTSLLLAYLDQLSELKIPGVYLETTSQNRIACKLYEKLGFSLLWHHEDHFWTNWFGYRIENLCYVRIIS